MFTLSLKVVILTFLCYLPSFNQAHLVKHVLEHADKTVSGLANVFSGGLLGGFKLNINGEVNSKVETPPVSHHTGDFNEFHNQQNGYHNRPLEPPYSGHNHFPHKHYGNFDEGEEFNNNQPKHPNSQHLPGPDSQNPNSYSYAYANAESFSYNGNDVKPENAPKHPGHTHNHYLHGHRQNSNGGYGNHGYGNHGYGNHGYGDFNGGHGNDQGGYANGNGGYGSPNGGNGNGEQPENEPFKPSFEKPSKPGYNDNKPQNGHGQQNNDHNINSGNYDTNGNFGSHDTGYNQGQNIHEYSKFPQNSHDTTITPKANNDDHPFYIPLGFDDSNSSKNNGEKIDVNIPDNDKVKRNEEKGDEDGEFSIDVRSKNEK